ncbi:uncharacterized protein LOC118756750 [Rhagoletis pomonella]|uniref:uncharacterized protein LOC118756750 n=1 Tax=Rhagoletis pomonella TaxID=28610 RepID=UPI00177DA9F9|nr:uncharacterized protein LOC118756750 [Rhagoletis pomonella]
MFNRQDGAVEIKCVNNSDRDILADEIKNKLSQKYDVEIPGLRYPKILISGLSANLECDKVEKAIRKQNDVLFEHLKCTKVFKSQKNPRVFNAFIEVDGVAFKSIIKEQRINIEWDRCMAYESDGVLRCYKCWGFNHKAAMCKEQHQICAKCGENDHSYRECQNNFVKCRNCCIAKARLNLADIDEKHDARDSCCRVLQRKVKLQAERTLY